MIMTTPYQALIFLFLDRKIWMKSKRHTRTAEIEDAYGKIFTAYKFQHRIAIPDIAGDQTVGGSTFWEFPNGRSINTMDDVDFTDQFGKGYRLVTSWPA